MLIHSKEAGPIRPETKHASPAAESPMLDPALAHVIRSRIQSGTYQNSDVIDKIARRVLDVGDL